MGTSFTSQVGISNILYRVHNLNTDKDQKKYLGCGYLATPVGVLTFLSRSDSHIVEQSVFQSLLIFKNVGAYFWGTPNQTLWEPSKLQ